MVQQALELVLLLEQQRYLTRRMVQMVVQQRQLQL